MGRYDWRNNAKLEEERFRLDIRKKFIIVRAERHWNTLPREAMGASFLISLPALLSTLLLIFLSYLDLEKIAFGVSNKLSLAQATDRKVTEGEVLTAKGNAFDPRDQRIYKSTMTSDRDLQARYRKVGSCLTNSNSFYDQMTCLVAEGKDVDVVYLDFSKAFDPFFQGRAGSPQLGQGQSFLG
ncbi:hypothetical protein TURU_008904 [Turdus rufiventris]|nr:hypothetical protein TURU_008904 [Turdus rufiventris]